MRASARLSVELPAAAQSRASPQTAAPPAGMLMPTNLCVKSKTGEIGRFTRMLALLLLLLLLSSSSFPYSTTGQPLRLQWLFHLGHD